MTCFTKTAFAALSLSLLASAPLAHAQAKPGNCAIYAEMAADTVKADARFKGADGKAAEKALRDYAKAQSKIVKRDMPQTYEASKAFGWDKATVDRKMKEGEDGIRKGFRTSTMDEDTLYMDHVMAVNTCAQAAKSADELGQSPDAMKAALETLMMGVRS